MNVLFLTVSTGHGHTSCAKALEGYLKENGANTYFLDIYGYVKPFLSKAVSDIYLFASGKAPKLYGKYYDKEDMGKTKFVEGILTYFGKQEEISSPTFTIVNEYNGVESLGMHFSFLIVSKNHYSNCRPFLRASSINSSGHKEHCTSPM